MNKSKKKTIVLALAAITLMSALTFPASAMGAVPQSLDQSAQNATIIFLLLRSQHIVIYRYSLNNHICTIHCPTNTPTSNDTRKIALAIEISFFIVSFLIEGIVSYLGSKQFPHGWLIIVADGSQKPKPISWRRR